MSAWAIPTRCLYPLERFLIRRPRTSEIFSISMDLSMLSFRRERGTPLMSQTNER